MSALRSGLAGEHTPPFGHPSQEGNSRYGRENNGPLLRGVAEGRGVFARIFLRAIRTPAAPKTSLHAAHACRGGVGFHIRRIPPHPRHSLA